MVIVFLVEFGRHLAPDLDALDAGEVATLDKVDPVCLKQLWPNQVVQVLDVIVLSDQRCRQTEFAVRVDSLSNFSEGLCRNLMHLVQHHEAPVVIANKIDHFLRRLCTLTHETEHRVGANQHQSLALQFIHVRRPKELELSRLGLLHHCLRVENDDVVRIDESPLQELTLPLVAADLRRAHHDCTFLDCARRRDTCQCLAGSAGQHDDTAACSSIREHL